MTYNDLKQYNKHASVVNKAFMSSSKDRQIAEQFARPDIHRLNQYGEEIKLFAIFTYEICKDCTGFVIETISEYPQEKEILITPLSTFKIINIQKNNDTTNHIDVEIYLKEI
ncbi:unnamed protein product [Didymodactylos carnosus]|uniref:NAD(P)(+)--arginine ADP-ribosyltransferase n=1 Tax=Didymodactylos carnosus TaxID=1234261 RepID=A0A816A6K5_9BILA|nr:unnamed protein product [Didymodactylos carnosus]CAF4467366.1 unnamed protein product [Didymodactylos carnosus]